MVVEEWEGSRKTREIYPRGGKRIRCLCKIVRRPWEII